MQVTWSGDLLLAPSSLRAPAPSSQQRTAVINRAVSVACLHFFCHLQSVCLSLRLRRCLSASALHNYLLLPHLHYNSNSTLTAGHGLGLGSVRSHSNDSSANRSLSSAAAALRISTHEPAGLPFHRQSLQPRLAAWATIMNSQASLL
jgi:hypothetical protein